MTRTIDAGATGLVDEIDEQVAQTEQDVAEQTEAAVPPDETVIETPAAPVEEQIAPADDVLAEERARFAPHGIKLGRDPVKAVRALGDALVEARAEASELRDLADLGRQFRERLIDETLKAGTRARGEKFRLETYRGILDRLSIEQIEEVKADLHAEGDERLRGSFRTVGGRRTRDEDETPGDAPRQDETPDAAYRA